MIEQMPKVQVLEQSENEPATLIPELPRACSPGTRPANRTATNLPPQPADLRHRLKSDTRARLQSINRLLEDTYGHPRWLSDILCDAGMAEGEIARLRRDHLDTYLPGLLRRWQSWMAEILPSRRDDIIIRRYSLNGSPRPSLANLGNEYGISRERVRQLEKDALKRLRHPARKRKLEHIALATAEDILDRPAE